MGLLYRNADVLQKFYTYIRADTVNIQMSKNFDHKNDLMTYFFI